eukprot:gene16690-22952_t
MTRWQASEKARDDRGRDTLEGIREDVRERVRAHYRDGEAVRVSAGFSASQVTDGTSANGAFVTRRKKSKRIRVFSRAFSATSRFLRLKIVKLAHLKVKTLSPLQEAAVLGASQALLRGDSRSSDYGSCDAPNRGASLLQLSCPAPNTAEDHVEACALPRSSGFTPLVRHGADMNLHPDAKPGVVECQPIRRRTSPVNKLTDTVQLLEACSDARALLAPPTHNDAANFIEAVVPVAQSSPGCAQRSTASLLAFLDD